VEFLSLLSSPLAWVGGEPGVEGRLDFWLLNAVTATRLFICAPVWFWCWWKRPRRMVLWMALVVVWFVGTDFLDGNWARDRGLTSDLGFWLDHLADFAFFGVIVISLIKGSREPALARRPFVRASSSPTPQPADEPTAAPPTSDAPGAPRAP
jgi:hypothetical protein